MFFFLCFYKSNFQIHPEKCLSVTMNLLCTIRHTSGTLIVAHIDLKEAEPPFVSRTFVLSAYNQRTYTEAVD